MAEYQKHSPSYVSARNLDTYFYNTAKFEVSKTEQRTMEN